MKKEMTLSIMLLVALSCSDDSPTRSDEHETAFKESTARSAFQASELDRIALHTLSTDTVTQGGCDSVEVANFTDGHRCCVTGKVIAFPGETLRFRYQTSRRC